MHGFIAEIGIAFLVATVLGLITRRMKQPVILGYFIAGVILGHEIGQPLVNDPANIVIISEIGLILLLFVIGLEMDVPKIFKSGRQILIAGVGQFLLCVFLGLLVFKNLGYSTQGRDLSGLYLALLAALSSTAIVVKLLHDKLELDTLHGRISIGILILQDIWVVLILAFQPNFHSAHSLPFVVAVLKCALLIGVAFLASKHLLSRIFQTFSRSPELVVVTSLGWCALVAGLANLLGLSKEMGALIAGLAISAFPYSIFVSAKILPLRDFFLILFFVSLGMKIPYPTLTAIATAVGLGCFILVSRLLSVYPLLRLTGSGRRTAFITSVNLSQLSEFSLVVASIGLTYHHIDKDLFGILIYTMALTAIASSYAILYSYPIFMRFSALLTRLGFPDKKTELLIQAKTGFFPIIVLGFHRGAQAMIDALAARNPQILKQILVIDFNVEALQAIRKAGVAGLYGDISSLDTLDHANIGSARMILSTIPNMLLKGTNNTKLVQACRSVNPTARIVATADFSTEVAELRHCGADEVLLPYSMVGQQLASLIQAHVDKVPGQ